MSPFDLNPASEQHAPTHGWIRSASGVRHLRLPVLRLYQMGQPTYARYVEYNMAGMWLQFRSPYRTLRQLAIVLRDLHREARDVLTITQHDWLHQEPSSDRDGALNRQREGNERIETLVMTAFILLRRLADELIDVSRPFLFQNWHSAPRKMSTAVTAARDGLLGKAKPLCAIDILSDALLHHTDWHAQLRKHDGIRDILVHYPHVLQVGSAGSKAADESNFKWRISAQLATIEQGELRTVDLLPALLECVAGACQFMAGLVRCVAPIDHYERGDLLFLTGSDNDIVGFWPAVEETSTEFPLAS